MGTDRAGALGASLRESQIAGGLMQEQLAERPAASDLEWCSTAPSDSLADIHVHVNTAARALRARTAATEALIVGLDVRLPVG